MWNAADSDAGNKVVLQSASVNQRPKALNDAVPGGRMINQLAIVDVDRRLDARLKGDWRIGAKPIAPISSKAFALDRFVFIVMFSQFAFDNGGGERTAIDQRRPILRRFDTQTSHIPAGWRRRGCRRKRSHRRRNRDFDSSPRAIAATASNASGNSSPPPTPACRALSSGLGRASVLVATTASDANLVKNAHQTAVLLRGKPGTDLDPKRNLPVARAQTLQESAA